MYVCVYIHIGFGRAGFSALAMLHYSHRSQARKRPALPRTGRIFRKFGRVRLPLLPHSRSSCATRRCCSCVLSLDYVFIPLLPRSRSSCATSSVTSVHFCKHLIKCYVCDFQSSKICTLTQNANINCKHRIRCMCLQVLTDVFIPLSLSLSRERERERI